MVLFSATGHIQILGKTNHPHITDLLGHGLNVARVKTKSDIDKQQNENNYMEHVQKDLSDLANRLNGLTLQGTDKKKETYIEITTVPKN